MYYEQELRGDNLNLSVFISISGATSKCDKICDDGARRSVLLHVTVQKKFAATFSFLATSGNVCHTACFRAAVSRDRKMSMLPTDGLTSMIESKRTAGATESVHASRSLT